MNYLRGKAYPDFECDKTKSFVGILCETLQKQNGSKIAAIDGITNEEISYNEILINALTISKHLKSVGVTKGDVVAFMVENSINMGSYLIGVLLAEAIIAPLNPSFTSYEFTQICSWLQPKIVVCSKENHDVILKCQEAVRHYQMIDCNLLIELMSANANDKRLKIEDLLPFEASRNDPVIILCSSGTTGMPKGVIHSNYSMMAVLDYLSDSQLGAENTDVTLAYLPFYHAMGFVTLLGNLYRSQKLIIMQKFSPKIFLNAIETQRVNKMYIVPTIALFLAQYEGIEQNDLSSLKELICAGSTLSKTIYNSITLKLPHIDLRIGYGMSEINYTTITPPFSNYLGSVGQLMPGCIAKVIDLKTKEVLPAYKTGELCIHSKSAFLGYYRNEKETLLIFDKEGFVHTGDVVYYDKDSNIFVVGRIKEMIKYKSYQVSPVELEAILLTHSLVADVGVVGVPDERCGELPRAYVVLRPEFKMANKNEAPLRQEQEQSKNKSQGNEAKQQRGVAKFEKELQEFVALHVSPYKKLTGGVCFVDKIPKNSLGKVLRGQLRTLN